MSPYKDQDAKELYQIGHEVGGILTRQLGESMYAYIGRRKHWYEKFSEFDDQYRLPDVLFADLLLTHSRISRLDRTHGMTMAAADGLPEEDDFEKYARVLQ